jgi:hypothetical protein
LRIPLSACFGFCFSLFGSFFQLKTSIKIIFIFYMYDSTVARRGELFILTIVPLSLARKVFVCVVVVLDDASSAYLAWWFRIGPAWLCIAVLLLLRPRGL